MLKNFTNMSGFTFPKPSICCRVDPFKEGTYKTNKYSTWLTKADWCMLFIIKAAP